MIWLRCWHLCVGISWFRRSRSGGKSISGTPRQDSIRVMVVELEILMNTTAPQKAAVLDRGIMKTIFVKTWLPLIAKIVT